MMPVTLDGARLRAAVVGEGRAALGRLRLLASHDVAVAAVFAPTPEPELAAEAGRRLVRRWPSEDDIAGLDVVFGAGLAPDRAAWLARIARGAKTLVNVEDDKPHCDFHVPATLRRGELLITVSTGGVSPRLARRIADYIGGLFGPEWAGRLAELGAARERWREEGLNGAALSRSTDAFITEREWLA